ncbi:MAG: cyclic nucleotide-binding domain-containing protein [Hyphomicrobiaceae bacterium]|nr:cyclic nucleotide-binding domain-containing protein [Hyphomicrobiaceae bacterium]
MTTDSLLTPFTRVAMFDGLSGDRLERIAKSAERIVFQAGDVIQSEGDIPDAAILVVSGKVLIVDDRADETGDPVVAGSLVGELAMLIETRAVSTVVARSSVRAFRITRRNLRMLMETDASLADHFVAKISQRLSEMAVEMRRVDNALAASLEKIPPQNAPAPAVSTQATQGRKASQIHLTHLH